MRSLPAALSALCLVSACGVSEQGTFCTFEVRPSTRVKVVDARGQPVRDARVTYTLDGGLEQVAECIDFSSQDGCELWKTEDETTGEFAIQATSDDGTRTARQEVTVTEDACHVITRNVTLTLPD